MFGASLNKLLIGAAISQGTKYIKDEYFQGSFLDTGLKKIGSTFGIDKFGESAPYNKVYEHLGLSVEKIVRAIQNKLRK